MAHLIDKDALVVEIENELNTTKKYSTEYINGKKYALKKILSFLDTLEVKEVDLEKELILWHKNHFKKEDTYEKYSGFYLTNNSQLDLAKHFFELGLKAKGE